jgi:hypothetical protein
VNLVETSPVYGNMAAQELLGECMSELIEDGRLTREVPWVHVVDVAWFP